MLTGSRCAIIIALASLCPFTGYAKSNALSCDATATVSAGSTFAIGAISGKLTRLDGTTAIAGATVKAYQSTTVVGVATTNETGDYTVGSLGSGTYSVEMSAVGYETTTQTGIAVTDGVTTTLNVSLPVPINYVYDELGRLVAVIDKDGNAATYSYDAVGNLLSISRQVPTQVSIIQSSPGSGPVGASVTIYGAGFSATATENAVAFNGVAATVSASSTNLIVTTVPSGATTGVVTVTSPIGSATSAASFTVTTSSPGAPTITGFTPTIGTPGTAVTITGTNFDSQTLNNRSTFNIVNSTVTSATTSTIATSVPLAGSGRISVATPVGKTTSSADFFIPPAPYTAANVLVTGRIAIGGSTSVSITSVGKIGLILFDATQGQRVYLNITVSASSNVSIYDPDGILLASVTASVSNPTYIDATSLATTGTYSIMLAPVGTGSATLTLYNVAPDFTSTITPGGSSVTATVTSPGQNVRLTFTGTTGQRVSLRVTNVTIPSTHNIYIYNPNGTTLYTTLVGPAGQFIEPQTLSASGTYTIFFDPYANNTGGATFTLYNIIDVNGMITPGGAAQPVTITAPGQNAKFTFAGAIGQQVSLNITAVTIANSTVSITKPDGTTLTSTSFGTGGSFIDNTVLPSAGTYTVFLNPSIYYTGNVTLTLYNVPDVTGPIVPGGSSATVNLAIPGQNARLTFSGSVGQNVSINVTGSTIGNCLLTIYKPDGASLAGTWQVGPGGFIDAQTLPVAGTYIILVNPTSTLTGSATLTLYDCSDIAGTISPGGPSVSVTISTPGQNASLTFSGAAGQQVSLNMTSVTVAGGTTYIKKPDGTTLTSASFVTGGGFIDNTTLPVAGTYTVFVNPSSLNTGNMTLTLYNVPDVTGPIVPGGSSVTVSLTIPGQNARLTFSGAVGQKVSINVTGATIGNCLLTIYKPDGVSLGSTWQVGSGGFIDAQTLPVAGTFTILVNPTSNLTGNATLTLYDCPDLTGTVTIGGAGVGVTTTAPGQNASLTFSGTSGQQVTVHVTSNTMSTVTVKLLKPDGSTQISSTSSSASFNLATQTLSVTGTFTISIDPSGANIGSMNVSVTSP